MNWTLTLEVIGVIGGIATLIALFLGPMLYLGSKIDNFRREFQSDIKEFRREVQEDMNEFRKEVKDFHGRLCAIEERNRQ